MEGILLHDLSMMDGYWNSCAYTLTMQFQKQNIANCCLKQRVMQIAAPGLGKTTLFIK